MNVSVIPGDLSSFVPAAEFPRCEIPRFRNGLIVRMPNHLGDAVMALPALAALKTILPEHCGLFVISPASTAQLYHALNFVDDTISLASPHRFYNREELRGIRQLRAGAAVLFNHSFRDAVSLKCAGIPLLYGEPTRMRSWLLAGKFPFPPRQKGQVSSTHQAMRYLAIAEALGGTCPESVMPELCPPCPVDELSARVKDILGHPLLLTIAPGAAYGAAKRWPHEYYAVVANYWIRRGGIVALVGAPSEIGICNMINAALPKKKCVNLCGKTSLYDLMQIFRFSAYALTNDSGLMHLASALRCPGMTVFGPTDFKDTAPVANNWKLLYRGAPCSPCLKRVCPKGNAICMTQVTPAMVIKELCSSVRELKLPLGKYFHR